MMIKSLCHGTILVPLFILALQFLMLPFLGDMDRAGKLFAFIFPTLFVSIRFLASDKKIEFAPVSAFFVALGIIFLASACQAHITAWAFIQACIFASFVIYLILLTDFSFNCPLFLTNFYNALLFSGLIAAIFGLYEYFHFGLNGSSKGMLIPYLLPSRESMRVVGMFGQPNHFALFLLVVLLVFFYRSIHTAFKPTSLFLSRVRFLPFFVVALAFFLTGSRAGILSLSLVGGFLLWLIARRRYLADNVSGRSELYCLVICLACALIVSKGLSFSFSLSLGGAFSSEIASRSLGDTGIGGDGRFMFWMEALQIFLDNPWVGVGLDNYGFLQDAYGPSSHRSLGFVPYEAMKNTDWAHNELLQILCEGGIFSFCLLLFLIFLLLWKIKVNFVARNKCFTPIFLYSHLLLLPFVLQSMFSWTFRSPPLLVLFFSLLGGLLSQYPLRTIKIPPTFRTFLILLVFLGVCLTGILFYWEVRIGTFKMNLLESRQLETTLTDFDTLARHPYSSYRVLNNALPFYANEVLSQKNELLAKKILPYYKQLTTIEGARWQWFDLARIYLLVGREQDANSAIQHAIDLMPSDNKTWSFQHLLDMLKASRMTGRPFESFLPHGEKFDLNVVELTDE